MSEIRNALSAARADAARLAAEQQEWRERVTELFERALDAGMTPAEIVEVLGLSAKWTEHRRTPKAFRDLPFFYGSP